MVASRAVEQPSPSFADIRALIARIPRVKLACTPTPMVEAPNLAKALGGPRIFFKRDDLTGVAFGGNKLRNLEFRLARTMAEKPDVVIVGLDLQSNSARQTVGACNKLGLDTILVLEGARPNEVQGNLLVDYLLGAEVHFAATRQEQRAMLDSLAEACRRKGRRPHILNDNPMFDVASAIAYLETTMEILEQLDAMAVTPTALYMSSSGKGQAGLEIARKLWHGFAIHGVTATREYDVPKRTAAIANETARTLGLDLEIRADEIVNFDGFVGEGYGRPSPDGIEAVRLVARMEGIILDPVYTGKCAAGMIAHIRDGRFGKDDTVVFVHTGGGPAIFTWNQLWTG
ncbi:MAG: pyridoxal-phosphate dependent enzyme [Proteobacteria bacterium]|nr:pyridoxal-phosphate dependent enzyme [Pseudomonadota bacterium]MBI3496154.1 pyridoxal-phosphate dependent enzyme [Pseudomonadota bacterium]